MSKQPSRQVKMPSLCLDRTTGWYFTLVKDASKPCGRTRRNWSRDKADARRLYQQHIVSVVDEHARHAPATPLGSMGDWTITELATAYWRSKETDGKSPAFLNQIHRYLHAWLHWLKGKCFNPAEHTIAQLPTQLMDEYRSILSKDSTCGIRQANHRIEHVRMLLLWLRNSGLAVPPTANFKPLPKLAKQGHGKRHNRTPLSADQIKKLLLAGDVTDRAILMLALNCGFGNSDLATLKLTETDLDAGRIHSVRRKTGVERHFAIWPETVQCLRAYLAKGRGKPKSPAIAELFFVGHKGNPLVWEIVSEDGGKLKRSDAVRCRFDRLAKKAGVSLEHGQKFYSLRHRYGTMLGEVSSDVREVQAAMGHSTMDMQQVYRHDREAKALSAQAKLRDALLVQIPDIAGITSGKATAGKAKPSPAS